MVERIRRVLNLKFREKSPLDGHAVASVPSRRLDNLSSDELSELNEILDWNCFTSDNHGRRFGRSASTQKRGKVQKIPERRISWLNDRVGLQGKKVLEVGCFEGVHTSGLCHYGAQVVAVDSRMENVVKTIVRTAFYDFHPRVLKVNVESIPKDLFPTLESDVIFHMGVLYHLKDPVRHLRALKSIGAESILLDTHFCSDAMVSDSYSVDGEEFKYCRKKEYGYKEVFSGMYDHAKWLRKEDIVRLLQEIGFSQVEEIEIRNERNGPRVLIFASKHQVKH